MMEAVSVSQALIHLNELLNHDEVLSDICVLGEVSRVSKAASGHTYFTVKDADSTLDAAIFRGGVGASYLVRTHTACYIQQASWNVPADRR